MKRLPEREADIQKGIIEYLEYIGATVVRVNNVGIYDRNSGGYIPPRQKGISDLIVCLRGHFIAIEVKRPGGRVSTEQEAFLEQISASGGIGMIAYGLDDVVKIFPADIGK